MKYHRNKHGMNWVTQVKRLALYLRDGLACGYCGQSIEDGASLSLDHIVSRIAGGSNHESNLITACKRCNDSKNDRSVKEFMAAVANYVDHGLTAKDIARHVESCRTRPLDEFKAKAKALIAERGSASRVIKHLR